MLLLFQALRDADPAFSIGLAFSHDFPRYVFCRTAHAPSPGKNNPVVEPTRQPIILLYPHWTSSNTVVALTDSGNNHGLKLADYKFLVEDHENTMLQSRAVRIADSTLS